MTNENRPVAKKGSASLEKSSKAQVPWRLEEQARVAVVLGQMFDMQKQFGKQTGQLENIIKGFCWVLAPYSPDVVVDGLKAYLQRHADFPTPSDIVKIIDPPKPEWKPDKSYYISLKQIHKEQGPYGLDDEEIEYVRRYEEHMRMEMKSAENR